MAEPGSPGAAEFLTAARAASAHVFVEDLEDPVLGPEDRHHLERVLRLRPGDTVSAVDGRGGWRLCTFGGATTGTGGGSAGGGSAGGRRAGGQNIGGQGAGGQKTGGRRAGGRGAGGRNLEGPSAGGGGAGALRLEPMGDIGLVVPAEPSVAVGFALTKGDRPEWAVQKLTEIGVERIIPLVTARSVVRWEEGRGERHLERLREVARQAGMQSRRLTLPVVEAPCSPAEAVAACAPEIPALAEPGGDAPSLAHPVILVGPEGGWDPAEVAAAPATVALGPHVLRTETAAVVAGALLAALRAGLTRPIGPADASGRLRSH